MLLSGGYNVYVHYVEGNWLPHVIEVNISAINIDTKVKIKTAFIDLSYGLTTIKKLLIVLII